MTTALIWGYRDLKSFQNNSFGSYESQNILWKFLTNTILTHAGTLIFKSSSARGLTYAGLAIRAFYSTVYTQ